ncbi:hypothetical protein C2857_001118 [Epichloe festucae Fl1]|uniref:Uncharacterized protein n=1 Tax=Epichloe festucae (strain Fl1) TaxID=877507 RepID=A0A7S9KJM5_EPIFF|nr:hypothetical protein C2857_001118 [Epichloe festucae Fl1]
MTSTSSRHDYISTCVETVELSTLTRRCGHAQPHSPSRRPLPLPSPHRRHSSSATSTSPSPRRPRAESLFNPQSVSALWPQSDSGSGSGSSTGPYTAPRMTPAQRQQTADQIWREFW